MVSLYKSESALFYECGYSCDNAILIKSNSFSYFLTDGRYEVEAKEHIKNSEVVIERDLIATASMILKKEYARKVAFDPTEFSAKNILDLESKAPALFLYPLPQMSQKKRIQKSAQELALIKESQRLNIEAFSNFAKYLDALTGTLSEKRLQYISKDFLTHQGEFDLSFEPIFALEGNGAKPHCLPSEKQFIKKGDSILFDAGIKYKRYCSDMTRTSEFSDRFTFSKEAKFKDSKRQKIYDTVLKAQETAIKAVKIGVKAKDVDKAARGVIEKSGYGKYFVHSTGHGIGLDIHELPVISSRSETILEEGMVFSIEPGIYLADDFGVRIEDLVAIKNGRVEIL